MRPIPAESKKPIASTCNGLFAGLLLNLSCGADSEHRLVSAQRSHRLHEALLQQYFKKAIDVDRRLFKLPALAACCLNDGSLIQVYKIFNKLIWMLRLDTKRLDGWIGKVLLIEGDDHAGAATNRRGQNMTIIRVWQTQSVNQTLVTLNDGIRNGLVHQRRRSIQLLGGEIGAIA